MIDSKEVIPSLTVENAMQANGEHNGHTHEGWKSLPPIVAWTKSLTNEMSEKYRRDVNAQIAMARRGSSLMDH